MGGREDRQKKYCQRRLASSEASAATRLPAKWYKTTYKVTRPMWYIVQSDLEVTRPMWSNVTEMTRPMWSNVSEMGNKAT